MDELVKLVSQKSGISEDAAKKAVDTVLGFLKKKLPAPVSGQIDAALKSPGAAGVIGKGLDALKGRNIKKG
jgi:hypothetical protein